MLEIAICDAESGRTPTSNTLSPRSPEVTIRTITDRFNPLQIRGGLEFGVASGERTVELVRAESPDPPVLFDHRLRRGFGAPAEEIGLELPFSPLELLDFLL